MISDKERKRIRKEKKRIEKEKSRRFTRTKTRRDIEYQLDSGYSQLPPDQRRRVVNTVDRSQRMGNRIRTGVGNKAQEGRTKIRRLINKKFTGGLSELLGFSVGRKSRNKKNE